MKFAHILPNLNVGGAQTAVFNLIAGLSNYQHYLIVDNDTHLTYKFGDNVKYIVGNRYGALNELKPNIIHFPGIVTNDHLDVNKLTYEPDNIVWVAQTVHNNVVPFDGVTNYIAVSDYMRRELTSLRDYVNLSDVIVVPNAASDMFFSKAARTNVSFRSRLVGRSCRASHHKFHEHYARVLQVARVDKFKLIGGGNDLREIQVNMLRHRVICNSTGNIPISDVVNHLSMISVFFHSTSTWIEGWSLAISEALALGIPVVCDDLGGNPETVNYGQCAFLIEHKNILQQAPHAIRTLLDNETEWMRISQASKEFANENLTCSKMAERYMNVMGYEYEDHNSIVVPITNYLSDTSTPDIPVVDEPIIEEPSYVSYRSPVTQLSLYEKPKQKRKVLFVPRYNACITTLLPIYHECLKYGDIECLWHKAPSADSETHNDKELPLLARQANCIVIGMNTNKFWRDVIYPISKRLNIPTIYIPHGRLSQPRVLIRVLGTSSEAEHTILFSEQQRIVMESAGSTSKLHLLGSPRLQSFINTPKEPNSEIMICLPVTRENSGKYIDEHEVGWKPWVTKLYDKVGNKFIVSPHYNDLERDDCVRYCKERGITIIDDPGPMYKKASVVITRALATPLIEANASGVPVILTDVSNQPDNNFVPIWFDNKRIYWRHSIDASIDLAIELTNNATTDRVEKLGDWFYVRNDNILPDVANLIRTLMGVNNV